MNKYNNPRLLNAVVSGTGMKHPMLPHVVVGDVSNGFIRGDLMDANAIVDLVNSGDIIDQETIRQAVADIIGTAPENLDTIGEVAETLIDMLDHTKQGSLAYKIANLENILTDVENIEQTVAELEDINRHPMYVGSDYFVYNYNVDSGEYDKSDIYLKGADGAVGPQGPQGDTIILGDGLTYILYNTTGQNTDGAMTQKAVTDALVAENISYDNAVGLPADNVQDALDVAASVLYQEVTPLTFNLNDAYTVAIGGGVWMATTSGHTYRCHIIKVEAGEVYEIVGRTTDTENSVYAWLTTDAHVATTTPDYLTGYEQNFSIDAGDKVRVTVPEGAEYMYIARNVNSKAKLPSSVSKLNFINEDIARLNDSVYGVGYKDKEYYSIASNSTSVIRSDLEISSNSYTKSMFVELKNARAFTIVANADNGSYYAFTSKTIETGDLVGALLPTDHERHFIAANETAYIDNIPEGAMYLYVLLIAANQTRFTPQSIMIHTDVGTGVGSVENKVENLRMVDDDSTIYTLNQSLALSHYYARPGVLGSECKWTYNSEGQHHILIPVGNASEITVTGGENATSCAFLNDDSFVDGTVPIMAVNETKRISIEAETPVVLDVPESANWLAVNVSSAGHTNMLPSDVTVTGINSNYTPAKYSELDNISKNAAATKAILGNYEVSGGEMNLQIVKEGREHAASCYWWYPAIISTRTPYKRIYHAFCDENGSAGIACINAFDKRAWKVILKNLKRNDEVDLHSIMSVYRVPSGNDEGKIVCAYSEGHNQTNWMHIRISKNPDDITEWNEHISVNLGALTTYAQFHYVNGKYYIFTRTESGAAWGYIVSEDLRNWSEYHKLIYQTGSDEKYFYIWLKPIADEPNMLKFISYGHPIRHDTGIRCGVIDFENDAVYDYVDMENSIGTLEDTFTNEDFTILIEHPNESTKGRQRMYDLAISNLDELRILYGRQKLGTQTDGDYYVYEVDYQTLHAASDKTQAGTRTYLCQSGLVFLDHSNTHAANGVYFIDKDTVIVGRSSQDYTGYDYIEIYKKAEGTWAFEKEVYKELKGDELLRNAYPIASPDGKYVMWMRGLVRLDQFEDAQTDLILYDVDNDVVF